MDQNRNSSLHSLTKMAMLTGVITVICISGAQAADWPQFRGPERNGISAEKGLLKQWPEGGPKLLWKADKLGDAHATPSVAKGKVFGMGLRGEEEIVWAIDTKTGKEAWATKIAPGIKLRAAQGGYGSRSTPTVVGDVLFAEGVGGEVVCIETASGKLKWHKNLVTEFGGDVPVWGYSESPLVDGDKVVVAPGGAKNTIVALNKSTGATIWSCPVAEGDAAHYSSAVIATIDGVKQYVHFLQKGVIGVNAASGKVIWRYNAPANNIANCSTPIIHEGHVFAASGYGTGGGLAKLSASADGTGSAKEVYFTKSMKNHHGGVVLVGDYIYGFDDPGALTCIEWKTGTVKWAERQGSVGKGSVTYVDGMLITRSERGPIALVEANPEKYVEHGRFEQPDRSKAPSWPYPVVSDGKLYIRDMDVLLCYDLKNK